MSITVVTVFERKNHESSGNFNTLHSIDIHLYILYIFHKQFPKLWHFTIPHGCNLQQIVHRDKDNPKYDYYINVHYIYVSLL